LHFLCGVCLQIFGATEDQPLDVAAARAALAALQQVVNQHGAATAAEGNPYTPKTVDEVASGFIAVANEAMCRPIRALTQMRVSCLRVTLMVKMCAHTQRGKRLGFLGVL